MAGADIILNLSASDELIGKHKYLRSLIAQQSARTICGYVYSSCGFGESTQDVVYGGNAMIFENGIMLVEGDRFSFQPQLQTAQIDVERMRYPWKFTHSMNMSGNMKLTNKWNINFSSGWDFTYHEFTTTTMSVTRDLHCFNMSCSMVLKPYTSYNFTIKANSSMLSDLLKVKKRSSYNSYVNWYDD